MSEIKVTFGALYNAQTDIAQTATRLQTQLEDLQTFLRPLVATWTGDAAVQYQARQNQWNNAQADLRLVFQQLSDLAGQAHANFVSTEQRIKSMF